MNYITDFIGELYSVIDRVDSFKAELQEEYRPFIEESIINIGVEVLSTQMDINFEETKDYEVARQIEKFKKLFFI